MRQVLPGVVVAGCGGCRVWWLPNAVSVRTVVGVGVMKRKKNPGPLVKQAVDSEVVSWGPATPTLRSDLDEPMRLPRPFLDLVSRFGEAKVRYDRGHLSKEQYAQVLARLVVAWADGTEWTLGATSGVWYRRFPGLPWVAATPPEGSEEEFDAWQRETTGDDLWSVAVMGPVAEVRDIGRPVDAADPWPVVTDEASAQELPAFSDASAVIDEHGVWPTVFSAAEDRDTERGQVAPTTALGAVSAPGVSDDTVRLPGLAELVEDAGETQPTSTPSVEAEPGAFELPAELFGDDDLV